MKGKEKRGIVIQQQSVIYLSWLRHGRWEWVSFIELQAYL
jgi:hypothetical protein